jgi:beta-lactamase class C
MQKRSVERNRNSSEPVREERSNRHTGLMLVLAFVLSFGGSFPTSGHADAPLFSSIIADKARSIFASDGRMGLAVVLLARSQEIFFVEGWADREAKVPVTRDSLFNLASVSKVFDGTLLSLAARAGELALDDPVSKHVPEIRGKHAAGITLRQLVSHTSGFTLPQDHPPWPEKNYTWTEFVDVLNAWTPDYEPGTRLVYSHGGFMLLHVALERALGAPYSDLLEHRILNPLGLASTTLPRSGPVFRGVLPRQLQERAVQGYSAEGTAAGEPGEQQGFYRWPGTGQMYSSPRDMSLFLRENFGEEPHNELTSAMLHAQQTVFQIDSASTIGLAWERDHVDGVTFVEKYGGLYNSSAYVGLIPGQQLGIVVLCNHGGQDVIRFGREVMRELAVRDAIPSRSTQP